MASSNVERQSGYDDQTARSDLLLSLCLFSLLVAFALSGLAWEENWRKLLRVLIGFTTYVTILLAALGAYGLFRKSSARFPFWAFALAGAMAEVSSGWLRPAATRSVDLLTALAAAVLIGGVHWLALRAWRPLRARILARSGAREEQ